MIQNTNIYIDGGDPEETHKANESLKAKGFRGLDGQTTNPSLIAKNLAKKQGEGNKITPQQAFDEYKRIVTEMRKSIAGPISIQVIGNPETLKAEEMLSQARDRIQWIPGAVIKFPCTQEGLKAVEVFCQEGPVNITLVFSQEQAAAVYAATKYHNYDCYVSPFVGRLDDRQEDGMDVVSNIIQMYGLGDKHVNVLAASTRTLKHLHYALWLKTNVMTIPYKLFAEWEKENFSVPGQDFIYDIPGLTEIPYREISLDKDWKEYNLQHDLTDTGLKKFWEDWSSVVS